jgi:hypothetical protein
VEELRIFMAPIINLNNTTPAAPDADHVNVTWQMDSTGHVSAYVPNTLSADADVMISAPSDGDALLFDSSTGLWKNGPASGISLEVNGSPNSDQSVLNLIAGTNVTLTAGAGGAVIIAASGGGGAASGTNVFPFPGRSSTDNGFGGYSILQKLPARMLVCYPSSWIVSINLASGASYVVGAAVVYRTAIDSRVVIDSTTITWGSSPTPTLNTAGENPSDAIALALDDSHDYYCIIYFSSSSGNINTGQPTWNSCFFASDEIGYRNANDTGISPGGSIPTGYTAEGDFSRVYAA